MVSSISRLLIKPGDVVPRTDASRLQRRFSNPYATVEPENWRCRVSALLLCLLAIALVPSAAAAQAQEQDSTQGVNRTAAAIGKFVGGAAVGLAAHEGGHLFFDLIFDADPGIKRVEFNGIPFFAITHRSDLSPRREFTVSSAGFWVQHATSEWLLTTRPRLRDEKARFAEGMLAFNIGASVAYSFAAFTGGGPPERDTRGMAASARLDEGWIGAIVLAPAVLDAWRYLDPEAKWAVWTSRALKVGAVLLVVR
jgi:hypothetical protein